MGHKAGVAFPVAALGRVSKIFGFVDWRRYASTGGLHPGVDVAAVRGAAVYAVFDGEVVQVGRDMVVLAHDGWWSVYGHVVSPFSKAGQIVGAGSVIAHVGEREYLHFEVRVGREGRFAPGVRAIWLEDGVWAVEPLRWLAEQMPAPEFCGGVIAYPGVRVYDRPDTQGTQVDFLPQGAAVEGQEMFWDVDGQIWMRLRCTRVLWMPVRMGTMMAEVRPCNE